jgi:hypothetical protein
VIAVAVLTTACPKREDEPEPLRTHPPKVGEPGVAPSGAASGVALVEPEPSVHRNVRDAAADAFDIGMPKAPPTWDLDRVDRAADVARYYLAGTRGAAALDCHTVGPSVALPSDAGDAGDAGSADARRVPIKRKPGAAPACADAGAGDGVFIVRGGDCVTRAGGGGPPLAPWPDGSGACEAARPVASLDPRTEWKNPIRDALVAMDLVPIRVELFGHGTYPIVTIAGWRNALKPGKPGPDFGPAIARLCNASAQRPFGIFAGLDRTLLLRVRCTSGPVWENL